MINKKVIGIALGIAVVTFAAFQNCARVKMKEPPANLVAGITAQVYQACVNGMTQPCSDASGTGIRCVQPREGVPNVCIYQSCNPGYMNQILNCVPVSCTPNQVANCVVPFGEGQMTCASNGSGYGACVAVACMNGYSLVNGLCVPSENAGGGNPTPTPTPDPENPSPTPTATPDDSPTPSPTPFCTAGSHRSCDTDSTYMTQVCNQEETGYGECTATGCKPGYNEQNGECVQNTCEAGLISPCTVGVGSGFQTCNAFGSAWGACELNSCNSGYTLIDGVCVEQTCTAGSQVVCEFDRGIGYKTCNANGTGYGSCEFVACAKGHHQNDNGVCEEDVCTPNSTTSCQVESGTGEMTCNANGSGYGACTVTSCDETFELVNGKCQSEDYCEGSGTYACTRSHGTGYRQCADQKKGPCILTACEDGYELKTTNGIGSCNPINNGQGKK